MSSKRAFAIDVETTGLSPERGGRVIEVAAVEITKGSFNAAFSKLINTNTPVPRRVQKIHGITDDMLVEACLPHEAWLGFLDFIGASTLIGHNVLFDMKFVRFELQLLGMSLSNSYQCTLDMSRKILPNLKSYKLENVSRYVLGTIPPEIRLHRALGDAMLAGLVWSVLIEKNQ